MQGNVLKYLKVRQLIIETSFYLLKKRKLGNFISIATVFCIIIAPSTLVLISSGFKEYIVSETRPYSYLILKEGTTQYEIAEFIEHLKYLKNIESKIITPKETKERFYQSIGLESLESAVEFPYSVEIVYSKKTELAKFKKDHDFVKRHKLVQSSESNEQFILTARLLEKSLFGFLYITCVITIIFCFLVSYVSSKSMLLLYNDEIKGLMLCGLGKNFVRQPIIFCGLLNGAILATFLYTTAIILTEKSSELLLEYISFYKFNLNVLENYAKELLSLITLTLCSYTLGAIAAARQIKIEVLIE